MVKFIKISATSLATFSLAFSVFAQSPSPTPLRQQVRDTMHEGMEEIRNMRDEGMDAMRESREESVEKMMEVRKDLQSRIDVKRAELRVRLQRIRDERKRQVVEKIDQSLDDLNKRVTDHSMDVLDKLTDILIRINERAERAVDRGRDMSEVDSAIVAAQEAIKNARVATEEQAAKTYVITINTEDRLRTDVSTARQRLHSDLRSLFEVIKVAKNAVHEAARAFAHAHGRDLPTPTPAVSPTVSP